MRHIRGRLMARGEVAAVFYLSGSDLRRFLDDQHLELLVATGGLASVALENVQYIEWLERERDRLNTELGLRSIPKWPPFFERFWTQVRKGQR